MPQNATKNHAAITPKQELFLLAYIRLATLQSACKDVGISDETARRWMKDESVRAAYQEMRARHLDETLAALISLSKAAITTLARNMSGDSPPGVQVRAAQLILELTLDVHKANTLEAQMAEFKALLHEGGIQRG